MQWIRGRAALAIVVVAIVTFAGPFVVSAPASAKVPGPNGRIAFTRASPSFDDSKTFTVDPDGTDVVRLLPGSELPRWSPDGTEVVVLSCQDPPDCTTALTIVDPDTGEVVRWFESPDSDVFVACIAWAPDGSHLACGGFVDADPALNGLYAIDAANGQNLTRLTSNPGGEDLPGDYSPKGGRIVFLRRDPDRPERRSEALFITRVDGSGTPHRITPWGLSQEAGSWSPDGDKILFAGAGILYTISVDDGKINRIGLGHCCAFDPVWSPNGTKIAFALYSPATSQADIWTARANGRGMHRVTRTRRFEHLPDWGTHPLSASSLP